MIIENKISVLIVVYNEERYIEKSIDSILNQIYSNIEIVIVNDSSTDRTQKIITSFLDQRIKLINNKENIGLTRSLNIGLKACRGEFIARLDGSDLMIENRLEKQIEFLKNNPKIAVVGSFFKCINETGKELNELNYPSGITKNIYRLLHGENPVGHPGVLMRKNIINKLGNYREEYYYSQDIDLWLRIYLGGYLIDNIPEYLTFYRIHRNSISIKNKDRQSQYHIIAFHDFYQKLTNNIINIKFIHKYLILLQFKKIKISYKEIFIIIKIFYKLHFALTLKLNLPYDSSYYYNKLDQDFKLNQFIIFRLFKLSINHFPKIINRIIN